MPESPMSHNATTWLQAWDSHGMHRTGTAGDNAGADWLAKQARALGASVSIEPFRFSRVDPVSCWIEAGGAPVFAALLPEGAVVEVADHSDGFLDRRQLVVPGRDDLSPTDLRSIAAQGLVGAQALAALGQAKAILGWHARHGFCGNCGAATRLTAAGWRRECDVCKAQHFPRTDPVVIMLVLDGGRCLLGRQSRWPKGMYSCLAGFVEPGETIEEAVRREVDEEAGIACGEVAYLASQPWPFPSSLMIGCFARALSREIAIDGVELEDARWFTRDDVMAMFDRRHPESLSAPAPMAIAHYILRTWADGAL